MLSENSLDTAIDSTGSTKIKCALFVCVFVFLGEGSGIEDEALIGAITYPPSMKIMRSCVHAGSYYLLTRFPGCTCWTEGLQSPLLAENSQVRTRISPLCTQSAMLRRPKV